MKTHLRICSKQSPRSGRLENFPAVQGLCQNQERGLSSSPFYRRGRRGLRKGRREELSFAYLCECLSVLSAFKRVASSDSKSEVRHTLNCWTQNPTAPLCAGSIVRRHTAVVLLSKSLYKPE